MAVLIFLSILVGLPIITVQLMRAPQRRDYKKNGRKSESYKQYCERVYRRYV